VFATPWPISAANRSTDRGPCASTSNSSRRRPEDNALPTAANPSYSRVLLEAEPTTARVVQLLNDSRDFLNYWPSCPTGVRSGCQP
jgi:hypothetical protein